MSRKVACVTCSNQLKKDERALCQKLFGIETQQLCCLPCLAIYLDCTVQDLEDKIEAFKEDGCSLFN